MRFEETRQDPVTTVRQFNVNVMLRNTFRSSDNTMLMAIVVVAAFAVNWKLSSLDDLSQYVIQVAFVLRWIWILRLADALPLHTWATHIMYNMWVCVCNWMAFGCFPMEETVTNDGITMKSYGDSDMNKTVKDAKRFLEIRLNRTLTIFTDANLAATDDKKKEKIPFILPIAIEHILFGVWIIAFSFRKRQTLDGLKTSLLLQHHRHPSTYRMYIVSPEIQLATNKTRSFSYMFWLLAMCHTHNALFPNHR